MVVNIYDTQEKYKTIYLDPPWEEKGGGKIKRGADKHYKVMSLKEIEALPIPNLADPEGCHLYMWVTNNFLEKGLDLIKSGGLNT